MDIHPTAIVHPGAELAPDVKIGPYAVVEDGVAVGEGCVVGPHAHLLSGTVIEPRCEIHTGALIGGPPQDLSFDRNVRSGVLVGEGTVVREYATIHRAAKEGKRTVVGRKCFLMGLSHVAHDVVLGDMVIVANGALLAGHVTVGDRAFISGNVAVHQHCRIGRLAMVGGLARVDLDIPPFMTAEGNCQVRHYNVIGMRRAGFSRDEVDAVRRAYRILYRSGLPLSDACKRIEEEIDSPLASEIAEFCRTSKRGISRNI